MAILKTWAYLMNYDKRIEDLLKTINLLLEKDRQRIAWREQVKRNLPKYTFEKMRKRIEEE